jgi:hypothetical protein
MESNRDWQGEFWPTPRQTLLLKASLLSGEAALDAWRAWEPGVDLAGLDAGSRRLLPLLYRNLRRLGVDDPRLPALKDQYRQAWLKNQRLLHEMGGLIQALHTAHIPTLVLKGAALAVRHYADAGLRPMTDFDLLVPTSAAPQAFARLRALDWQPALLRQITPERQLSVRQSAVYRGPDGEHFDLHWHVLWESCHPGADAVFWQHAVPLKVGLVQTLALGPADQLLHVCVHGARWDRVPALRWVPDALHVLSNPGGVLDWDHLLRQARALRVALPLADTLAYLGATFGAPVPREVIAGLRAVPVSPAEQRLYQLKAAPLGLAGDLPLEWYHYRVMAEAAGQSPSARGFWGHLQALWDIGRPWHMPGRAIGKALKRLGGRLGRSPAR